MRILVINGSPKGKYSITLQTVLYLQKLHPEHTFEVLHAGQRINALEKDFSPALAALEKADLLLFSYPVYTFIAPYQLHKFIRLMKEHKAPVAGKFATQITTSKHFYDVTAHRYVEDNCHDLGLRYIKGLSADMEDLPTKKGQQEAKAFFEKLLWSMENGYTEPYYPISVPYTPAPVTVPDVKKAENGRVVIICDGENDMVRRFRAVLGPQTDVVYLQPYPFTGGCLGCSGCATYGKCIYKDGFDEFLRTKIQSADAMIYAFTICDHSMGTRFKLYDDRQFCNGHRTVTMGTPVGYLISGNYAAEPNLRTILEARAEVGSNIYCGVATDAADPDGEIDRLAESLRYALKNRPPQPQNFYGVGGMKIFRDLIYQMQGMMKADHKFFKSHGQYDFPQKKKGTILKMHLVGMLISNPKIKAKMGNKMNEGMLAPYKKVLDNME